MPKIEFNKVRELLERDDRNELKKLINEHESNEIALVIDQLNDQDKISLYLLIPTRKSSEVLLEVSQHSRKFILKSLKDKYVVSLIEKADSDDSADILGEVSENKAKRIIENLPEEKKEAIQPLIKYEEDSAGGLMQSELVAIKSNLKVKEALTELKKRNIEGINYIYVVDSKDKLKGVISLDELLISQRDKGVGQIMKKEIVTLDPKLDKEKVAEIFKNEDILALPVVDRRGRLLGRVTVDDVLDVMEEEATEDMFKIAGIHPDEHLFDPVGNSIKRRLPWLIINLGTAFIAALIVTLFSNTLQAVIILAAFMPMIAGLGGNSGTQTLTLIVRGIALNQLDKSNYRKIVFREAFIGMMNGFILGLVMGSVAAIWQNNIMLGIVIVSAMTISLTLAGFIAASVPMMLKTLKIDPAIASSVFITASIDIIGFFSFLGIATLLLQWLV
jgi:magnesium transporter